MKNKKMIKKIISLGLFAVMVYLFIYFGTKDYHLNIADNIRFSNDYKDISTNNIFKYAKSPEILDILNRRSGVIFMGFSSNIWSHYYADYLNEVGMASHIDKIYYYDFKSDRELNTNTYLSIVSKLKDYLYNTDTGKKDLFAPSILIVRNGKIIYYDDEVSMIKGNITPEEFFTDYKKNLLMENVRSALNEYLMEN